VVGWQERNFHEERMAVPSTVGGHNLFGGKFLVEGCVYAVVFWKPEACLSGLGLALPDAVNGKLFLIYIIINSSFKI
jgi:hypothetical protein